MSPHWSRSDVQCDLWPWQRKQKKGKRYSPRPPTSPYRSQSLRARWPPVCSSMYQVLLKSVQWFCRCGLSKIAISHYFDHWLIQPLVQVVLLYKPWYAKFHVRCMLLFTVDRCRSGHNQCHADAICHNTTKAYRCRCKQGFYGNGKICVGQCRLHGDLIRTSRNIVERSKRFTRVLFGAKQSRLRHMPYGLWSWLRHVLIQK